MPTSIVTGPDGSEYEVTHPEGATDEEILSRIAAYSGAKPPNPEDTQPLTTMGMLGEMAKSANEAVLAVPDLIPKAINQGLYYSGIETRIPTLEQGLQWLQEQFTGDTREHFTPKGLGRDISQMVGIGATIGAGFTPVQRSATKTSSLVQDLLGVGTTVDDQIRVAEQTSKALQRSMPDEMVLNAEKLTDPDAIFAKAKDIAMRDMVERNRPFFDDYEATIDAILKENTKKGQLQLPLVSENAWPEGIKNFSLKGVTEKLEKVWGVDPKVSLDVIAKKGGLKFDDLNAQDFITADKQFTQPVAKGVLQKPRVTWKQAIIDPAAEVLRLKLGPQIGGTFERAVETATRKYGTIVNVLGDDVAKVATLARDNERLKGALLDLHFNPEENMALARSIVRAELGDDGVRALDNFFTVAGAQNSRARKILYRQDELEKFDDLYYLHTETAPKAIEKSWGLAKFQSKNTAPTALKDRSRPPSSVIIEKEGNLNKYENPILSHMKWMAQEEQLLELADKFKLRPSMGKNSTTADFFGEIEKKLLRDGFDPERAKIGAEVMNTVYQGSMRASNPVVRALMNLGYAGTLGQFKSAALNLHDVFVSMTNQGLRPTMASLMRSTKGEFGKSMTDLGLGGQNVGEYVKDFDSYITNPTKLERLVQASHKVSDVTMLASGFQLMDRIGKGVVLRSAVNQARQAARSGKLYDAFGDVMNKQELKIIRPWLKAKIPVQKMPKDVQRLIEEMAFTKLGQQQLISMAGRPLAYANNPNARVLYALSGFAIKQLALLNRNVVQQLRQGNAKAAAEYAAKYAVFAGLGYGLIDETRDSLVKDQKFQAEDVLWGALEQISSVLTVNRVGDPYSLDKFADNPAEFLMQSVLPPLGLTEAAAQDAANFILKGEYDAELVKRFPVLGDFYKYYWDPNKKAGPESKAEEYKKFIENWGED